MSLIYICLTLSQQAEGIGKQTYSKYKKNLSIIAVEWWNRLSYKMVVEDILALGRILNVMASKVPLNSKIQ